MVLRAKNLLNFPFAAVRDGRFHVDFHVLWGLEHDPPRGRHRRVFDRRSGRAIWCLPFQHDFFLRHDYRLQRLHGLSFFDLLLGQLLPSHLLLLQDLVALLLLRLDLLPICTSLFVLLRLVLILSLGLVVVSLPVEVPVVGSSSVARRWLWARIAASVLGWRRPFVPSLLDLTHVVVDELLLLP